MQVFSTVPLIPNLISLVQHDFNIGTFAQFGDPFLSIHFNHRTGFYNESHLLIRQQLDAENFEDPFMLVDGNTAQSHAVWYVTTTDDSYGLSELWPPVTYPVENYTLWQAHILLQDFPLQVRLVENNVVGIEDLIPGGRIHPYDPHDPQNPPYTEGYNLSTKVDGQKFSYRAIINATFSEVMYTNDPNITQSIGITRHPQWAVGLTPAAAKLAGLVSPRPDNTNVDEWWYWFHDTPPQPGHVIQLQAYFDWDNPRWPRPGVAGQFPGPTTSLGLAGRVSHGLEVIGGEQCIRRGFREPRLTLPGAKPVRAAVRGTRVASYVGVRKSAKR